MNGLPHRERFEDFEPCASADAERHDVYSPFLDECTYVINGAGDSHGSRVARLA